VDIDVSRAFGQFELKNAKMISNNPDINKIKIENGKNFILLCCRGLNETSNSHDLAEYL
jgi:serine/threonine protein phosphatase PrpC